jgi:hypothetical protein
MTYAEGSLRGDQEAMACLGKLELATQRMRPAPRRQTHGTLSAVGPLAGDDPFNHSRAHAEPGCLSGLPPGRRFATGPGEPERQGRWDAIRICRESRALVPN